MIYDNIIFSRKTHEEVVNILNIIHMYKHALKHVNLDKLDLSFSQNVPNNHKVLVQGRIGVTTVKTLNKHLGLPTIIVKPIKIVFLAYMIASTLRCWGVTY